MLCCVDLDRDADELHHWHQIFLLTQKADNIKTQKADDIQRSDDIKTQIEALMQPGNAYLRRNRDCAGHAGAVTSFGEAFELAKRAGNPRAEKGADKGMRMPHATMKHTEEDKGIPMCFLMMGERLAGAFDWRPGVAAACTR